MKKITVNEFINIVDGELIRGNADYEIEHIYSYVESLKHKNSLLFLLQKWMINWDLIKKNTPCIIVTDKLYKELNEISECSIILVKKIETAYWTFINYYRGLFDIPVIAVTGTSGKSTTVGMIEHILNKYYKTVSTKNSANGRTAHFGYLLSLDEDTKAGVFETAVGKPGDITLACRYFKPNVGIITNIGIYHLDGCKTIEGYINAKAEILTALDNKGTLIINNDDERTKKIDFSKYNGKIITIGIENDATFQASKVKYSNNGMEFTIHFNNLNINAFVPGYGVHQVYNALASIAAVYELGIGIKEAIDELVTYKKLPLRQELKNGINNCLILDDSWNLNTTSLISALETYKEISKGKKRVVLLGTLHKTGEYTDEILEDYGKIFNQYKDNIDVLVTLGKTGQSLIDQAEKNGVNAEFKAVENEEEAFEYLFKVLDENSILLLKAKFIDIPQLSKKIVMRK